MSIRFQSWRDDWPMNFLLTKREIIKVERFLAMVAQQTNTAFSLKLYADFLDAYTNTSPDGGVLSKRWAFHADETALALCIRSVAITIVKSEARGIDTSEEIEFIRCWQNAAERAGKIPADFNDWRALNLITDENFPDKIDEFLLGGPAFHHDKLHR